MLPAIEFFVILLIVEEKRNGEYSFMACDLRWEYAHGKFGLVQKSLDSVLNTNYRRNESYLRI